jgi:hypothetical protein
MPCLDVDGVIFDFPDDWQVGRYDAWSFYRSQIRGMWNGIKAVDLLALDPRRMLWAIEVKDYRMQPRTKPSALPDEVARKVFYTLCAMLPAKLHATEAVEKQLAKQVCSARGLRVVLHLMQPQKHSGLRPRAINLADVQQALRRLIKPIDPHPLVIDERGQAPGWQCQ